MKSTNEASFDAMSARPQGTSFVGEETTRRTGPVPVEAFGGTVLSSLEEVRKRVAAELEATKSQHLSASHLISLDQNLGPYQEPLY